MLRQSWFPFLKTITIDLKLTVKTEIEQIGTSLTAFLLMLTQSEQPQQLTNLTIVRKLSIN